MKDCVFCVCVSKREVAYFMSIFTKIAVILNMSTSYFLIILI